MKVFEKLRRECMLVFVNDKNYHDVCLSLISYLFADHCDHASEFPENAGSAELHRGRPPGDGPEPGRIPGVLQDVRCDQPDPEPLQ